MMNGTAVKALDAKTKRLWTSVSNRPAGRRFPINPFVILILHPTLAMQWPFEHVLFLYNIHYPFNCVDKLHQVFQLPRYGKAKEVGVKKASVLKSQL